MEPVNTTPVSSSLTATPPKLPATARTCSRPCDDGVEDREAERVAKEMKEVVVGGGLDQRQD